jgi:hypothetical protein
MFNGNSDGNSRSPTTNLEDTMLVAFMVLKGHKIKLWRDATNPDHVSFDILGSPDEIEASMKEYYENKEVGVADFVRCLKDVKSQMYNMKKIL